MDRLLSSDFDDSGEMRRWPAESRRRRDRRVALDEGLVRRRAYETAMGKLVSTTQDRVHRTRDRLTVSGATFSAKSGIGTQEGDWKTRQSRAEEMDLASDGGEILLRRCKLL